MARELFLIDELGAKPVNWGTNTAFVFDTGGAQRSDLNGNGGVYAIRQNQTATGRYLNAPALPYALRNFWVGGGFWRGGNTNTSTNDAEFMWLDSGLEACSVQMEANDGILTIRVGGSARATSAESLLLGTWVHIDIEVFMHATLGYIRVWVDKKTSGTPTVEFEGDTDNAGRLCEVFSWRSFNSSKIDDWALNSISMSYTSGTGSTPVAGNTITDGTTGATAVITFVVPGSTGTSGRLILEQWSDVDFANTNTITHTGGFSADVDAPTADYKSGFEPSSKAIGNEFVVLGKPNANGNSSQLTGSDGNSVDNYLLVNDVPTNAADYVEGTTTGLRDTYKTDLSSVLPAASEIKEITAVQLNMTAVSDLTGIDHVRGVIRQTATDYDSADLPLPSSSALVPDIRGTQPDGSGAWDRAALVDANFEIGAEVNT